jgi:hypothetical protein
LEHAPSGKKLYADNYSYSGQPIIVSEYGGICLAGESSDGWGYSSDSDAQAYAEHIAAITSELRNSSLVQGYCYTQLYDIETEQNGLLTYDRQPKIPLEIIRRINLDRGERDS